MAFIVEMEFREGEGARVRVGEAHRSYWKRMAERGILLGGGPWRDGSGELLLCEARDRASLLRIVYSSPYVQAQIATGIKIREWDADMGHVVLAALERTPTAYGPLGVVRVGSEPPAPRQPGKAGARRPAIQDGLTAHERRIATLMLDGMTNKQIAERFTVSTRAVELHITRIYRKLEIRRRAQLATVLNRAAPGF
ncbi:LuxR C-terminal-related transcriptional regulator [Streptomyces sp. NPDC005576]|uniref:LuxR C-terminal-related transcriptional regulator n=1 Tax=Streptomyces sp. NPDC005576 TaxID=3364726 RepID=UPI003697E4B8